MLIIRDKSIDPYWNLAAEEYLLTAKDEPIFRLWRNDRAVIVGRNQNTRAEINRDFVERGGIAVVRRMTGGGAVFHDLGNVNYTFIDLKGEDEYGRSMFRRFSQPIVEALAALGVEARIEGRNDLTVDGLKISGTAMCVHRGRLLHHGTLLFSAKMDDLTQALLPRPEKYEGRGVASVRSRVTNISQHLREPMSVVQFLDFLGDFVGRAGTPYEYSSQDIAAIDALARDKYRRDEWNYGTVSASGPGRISAIRRFPAGLFELSATIEAGSIAQMDIKGDYFFCRPTEEFCRAMEGASFTREELSRRLKELPLDDYFCGVSEDEILGLLFDASE
ncbi:MAG: lipoate--protein ligase [Bacteroidales bacterium]|nr:lipoate--protein ligase [Bacteroidales bacterium]